MDYKTAIINFISDDLLMGLIDEPIASDENLLTSGLVDSIGVMRIVMFIDEEFDISVPPEDVTIDHFLTVDDMASYLEMRTAKA